MQKVETKKKSSEKVMSTEHVREELSVFRQSLKHLEKTFERDDKYASLRSQIESIHVDFAKKNKYINEK